MSNIKKNFLFSSVLSLSQIIFPIITFPYVTRVLLPKGLGSVNFIDSIVQYIIIVSALGIPIYAVREIARVKDNKVLLSKTYTEMIVIHTIISLLCSVVFGMMIFVIPELFADYQLCIIGIGIILSNVFLINWFFAGLEKFVFISIVSIVVRVITVLGIFLLVKAPEDKVIYYSLNLVGNIITGIVAVRFALRETTFTFGGIRFYKHLRSLFLLFSLTVITNVYVLLDSVILGFIKNNEEVAFYATATKLSKIPISLLFALTSVLIPKLSSLQDKDKFSDLLSKSVETTFILSIPIAIGLVVLSKELILIFAGEMYLPGLEGFRVLSFIIIPIGFALVNHQILLPYNKEKYMMRCAIAGMVTSLILNFTLVPCLGNLGSAISSLTTEIVVSLLLFFVSYKICKIKIPYRIIFYSIITCSSFFLIKYFLSLLTNDKFVVLIFTLCLCSFIYFFVMSTIFKVRLLNDFSLIVLNKIRKRKVNF